METMERKRPHPRRALTEEFKAEIVERCLKGDRSVAQGLDYRSLPVHTGPARRDICRTPFDRRAFRRRRRPEG
jgi:hypothetical protein